MPQEQIKTKETVRSALEDALALIETPEQAEAVITRVETSAAASTEEQRGVAAAQRPQETGQRVADAVHATHRPATERTAAALTSAAAEAVAPKPAAAAAVEAAREALGTRPTDSPAADDVRVRRGREHLKLAALRQMAPLQALDARIFLALNQSPHPRWADRAADWLAITANGGVLWVIAVAAAGIAGAPRPGRVLGVLVPTVALTGWTVEHPIKEVFRRRRPFIDVVRALVVGKEPGSWSFPSGHTATAFAAAVVVGAAWRPAAALAYALAGLTGLSRIYVGVHYPGDVLSGAACGALIGTACRSLLTRAANPRGM